MFINTVPSVDAQANTSLRWAHESEGPFSSFCSSYMLQMNMNSLDENQCIVIFHIEKFANKHE